MTPVSVMALAVVLVVPGLDETKAKREDPGASRPFEFVQKTQVARRGDRVEIAFETKTFCDVTVAIEESVEPSGKWGQAPISEKTPKSEPVPISPGRIIRHLASGVLGPNAPAPLQKDSKKQAVVWDGKDDQGRYIDDLDRVTVRVSLGLRAQFERTLYWSPYKRSTDPGMVTIARQCIAATPEGVYVYEPGAEVHGGGDDQIRLYDHEGRYLRTVYPPPATGIRQLKGLPWAAFPPGGERFPVKGGAGFNTFLTCGTQMLKDYAVVADRTFSMKDMATSMAASGGRLFLAGYRLNRLPTGPEAGEVPLEGPQTSFPSKCRGDSGQGWRPVETVPMSIAASPDGKWLYLTSYSLGTMIAYDESQGIRWYPGVARMPADGAEPAKPFLGVFDFEAKDPGQTGAGADNAHFNVPRCVTCDAQGRLYVADCVNNRVQVFQPDGTYLKSIPCPYPTEVRVSPKTGEIYVFTLRDARLENPATGKGAMVGPEPMLTRFGPVEDPKQIAVHQLKPFLSTPRSAGCGAGGVEVDFYAERPTIWLGRRGQVTYDPAWPEEVQTLVLVEDGGRLVVKRDFLQEAKAQVARVRTAPHGRQRLYFNPGDGRLYVGEQYIGAPIHMKSYAELVRIDPETGKSDLVGIPCTSEDMAFDMKGLAYLRGGSGDITQGAQGMGNILGRFNPAKDWEEVPFDYGEAYAKMSYQGIKETPLQSGVTGYGCGNGSAQLGGIAVSPKGHLAVTFYNTAARMPFAADRRALMQRMGTAPPNSYRPRLFPGRANECYIHVWDEFGRLLYEDAVPGIGETTSLGIDKDDNLYLLTAAQKPEFATPPFPPGCTLLKVKAGKARIVSSGDEEQRVSVPLPAADRPKRPPDLLARTGLGPEAWIENGAVRALSWTFGGVGQNGGGPPSRCHCGVTSQFALDYFARSFVPEMQRYDVAVLDANGNTILRIGRYGNVDDGRPLVGAGGASPEKTGTGTDFGKNAEIGACPRFLGGDEVALVRPAFVATDTDRRLFIADSGNARILSVKLDYRATEVRALSRVPLKEVHP